MPKSTRDWAQRELRAAVGNIEWALDKLAKVVHTYHADHPEVSEPLAEVGVALEALSDAILVVRKSF